MRWFTFLLLFWLFQPCPLWAGNSASKLLQEDAKAMEIFARAQELIRDQAYSAPTRGELTYAAIQGMLHSLDPYSAIFTKAEYRQLEQESMGRYVGLGLQMVRRGEDHLIARVYAGGPAKQAGIKRGDRILAINGKTLAPGMKLSTLLGGRPKVGKRVQLLLWRENKKFTVKLKTAEVSYPSTQIEERRPGLFIVSLSDFIKNSAQELRERFQGQPPQGMILDLRDNPGGLLFSAIEVAELFLRAGKIVEVKNRQGEVIESYQARGFSTLPPFPLAVLLNRETASSAELLAGSLKDQGRAKLFGEKSYGKGSVQQFFPLGGDFYLKLTIAHYFTAGGASPQGIGIEPDQVIAEDFTAPLQSKGDPIFQAAWSWLLQQRVTTGL